MGLKARWRTNPLEEKGIRRPVARRVELRLYRSRASRRCNSLLHSLLSLCTLHFLRLFLFTQASPPPTKLGVHSLVETLPHLYQTRGEFESLLLEIASLIPVTSQIAAF